MENLTAYDTAAATYHEKLEITKLPLISWGFDHEVMAEEIAMDNDSLRLELLAQQNSWNSTYDFKKLLKDQTILVTKPDLSIVFASRNMIKMNGYTEAEVLGKSPKLFQGEATSAKVSKEIRQAINQQKPFEKTLVNYRKNGKAYDCLIKGFPVFSTAGTLVHFIAFEKAA